MCINATVVRDIADTATVDILDRFTETMLRTPDEYSMALEENWLVVPYMDERLWGDGEL